MPRGNRPTAQNKENETVTESTSTETVGETPAEKAPRKVRTPAERATARVDAAAKKLQKATKRRDRIAGSIDEAEKDVSRAQRLLDFTLSDEDVPAGYKPEVDGDEDEVTDPEPTELPTESVHESDDEAPVHPGD